MNELIKVNNKGDIQTTSARDLVEFLDRPENSLNGLTSLKTTALWKIMIIWFSNVYSKVHSTLGGRPANDYEITIDMAKELAMLQNRKRQTSPTIFY